MRTPVLAAWNLTARLNIERTRESSSRFNDGGGRLRNNGRRSRRRCRKRGLRWRCRRLMKRRLIASWKVFPNRNAGISFLSSCWIEPELRCLFCTSRNEIRKAAWGQGRERAGRIQVQVAEEHRARRPVNSQASTPALQDELTLRFQNRRVRLRLSLLTAKVGICRVQPTSAPGCHSNPTPGRRV